MNLYGLSVYYSAGLEVFSAVYNTVVAGRDGH